MILLPLLPLLLAAADPIDPDIDRFKTCAALVRSDPQQAEAVANQWRVAHGGYPAGQCLGLAFVAQERWAPAALAFEQAAIEAEQRHDGRAGQLWAQAGNAALAGDDAGKARIDLDHALAVAALPAEMAGEARLDRARADVVLNDPAGARADLDLALAAVPADPMAWLLSATLARRQKDAPRAARDIAEALRLAPDDPAVAYESGNIAQLGGDDAQAKAEWARATRLAPDDPAGEAATDALAAAPKR